MYVEWFCAWTLWFLIRGGLSLEGSLKGGTTVTPNTAATPPPPKKPRGHSLKLYRESKSLSFPPISLGQRHSSLPKPHPTSPSRPVFTDIKCSLHHLLSSHKVNTASGPDAISSQMLHGTVDSITPAITTLFNLSEYHTSQTSGKKTGSYPSSNRAIPLTYQTTDQSPFSH